MKCLLVSGLLVVLSGCVAVSNRTNVTVTAADPKACPEMYVDINRFPAGKVTVDTVTQRGLLGDTVNTTFHVPAGTKVILIPPERETGGNLPGDCELPRTPASRPAVPD